MWIKRLAIVFICLIPCLAAFAQGWSSQKSEDQIGYSAMELRYGYSLYFYTFSLRNGVVTWKYSGPQESHANGRFMCNNAIEGDIITEECQGVVYWNFAGGFIWEMVENKGKFDSILYKWAIEALQSSLSKLEKGKKTSPEAYERVQETYLNIKLAEEGKARDSLWETLCLYSYAMSEHPLLVEDLYNYDF